jgi:hypothetical protein
MMSLERSLRAVEDRAGGSYIAPCGRAPRRPRCDNECDNDLGGAVLAERHRLVPLLAAVAGLQPAVPFVNAYFQTALADDFAQSVVMDSETALTTPTTALLTDWTRLAGRLSAAIQSIRRPARLTVITFRFMPDYDDLHFAESPAFHEGISQTHVRGLFCYPCLRTMSTGGLSEVIAAETLPVIGKPVVAYIAGWHAPPMKRMGHAGAVLATNEGTASAKTAVLVARGAVVADQIVDLAQIVRAILD